MNYKGADHQTPKTDFLALRTKNLIHYISKHTNDGLFSKSVGCVVVYSFCDIAPIVWRVCVCLCFVVYYFVSLLVS